MNDKKVYESPCLTEYGQIEEITAGLPGGSNDVYTSGGSV
jgi:hypothetical protein